MVSAQSKFKIDCTLLAVLACLVAWYLLGGRNLDLRIPLLYSNDGLFQLTVIKRLIDESGYLANGRMGFPFGSTLYDFPGADAGSLLILKLLGTLSGSPIVAFNAYFLMGFPVCAIVSYSVFRKLAISRCFSVVGALLFTFLPFHMARISHLYYTWYFVIPLFFLYAWGLSQASAPFLTAQQSMRHRLAHAAALLLMSSFGIYYAFFGCIVLMVTGILGSLTHRSWKNMTAALIALGVVTLGVVANMAPHILYKLEEGLNSISVLRDASESEIYGLKIVQLLLPQGQHRSSLLASLSIDYASIFPLVNENSTASLGVIGSIGFLYLLVVLLLQGPGTRTSRGPSLYWLATTTLVILLIATVGGFSSLFAIFVSPLIRGWNRISIFIGFASLVAAMYAADAMLMRWRDGRSGSRVVPLLVAASILVFGLWDQTGKRCAYGCSESNLAEYLKDKKFIQEIEQSLPVGAALYQLPFMAFPESPPIQQLADYVPAKGYLLSNKLQWSYGAMKGRDGGDGLFRILETQNHEDQIEILKYMGFSGLYIDRRGYADRAQVLETEFKAAGQFGQILENDDGNLVFMRFADTTHAHDLAAVSPASAEFLRRSGYLAWEKTGNLIPSVLDGIDFKTGYTLLLKGLSGVSNPEPWGRWSVGSTVILKLRQALPQNFTLKLRVNAFGPNIGRPVEVEIGDKIQTFVPQATMDTYRLVFRLNASADSIRITVPEPKSPSELGQGPDGRKLGIGFESVGVELP